MEHIGVVGAGAWGTTLAKLLTEKGHAVTLWVRERELAVTMAREHENSLYLPGIELPEALEVTTSLAEVARGCSAILLVTPSHVFRSVFTDLLPFIRESPLFIIATKGLEPNSCMTMWQVLHEVAPSMRTLAVLSGPTFAKEVSRGLPTAAVAASAEAAVALRVQGLLSTPTFRVYAGSDPLGVELGGAIKNVIAIAAGIVDGLGLGHNALAALITRGLHEMTRLGVAMGARAETFAGLAGLGDLVLTCTGDLSRNRQLGLALGRGAALSELLERSPTVKEGVNASKGAVDLARRFSVDMPICQETYAVLFEHRSPKEAVASLLGRVLKSEEV
ncbi:NAD(P)H-dependent glycerol-3-phosphate dehydrogenase [Candidatus Methylomirabilis sp.]|uniref:NAD(P)H-dependent glycerol-3-phosphate dehydrogenase n=1 Tax=Candidatus Methylomirabilis sp. TaxID=2032687 RepID=UPI002A5F3739|nr:NAD(P)-dependent glycerol-3-phosphate dehydrogenase [Candidatus Methylomirabilis sp.]